MEISNILLYSPPIKVKSEIQGFKIPRRKNSLLVSWELQEQSPHPYVEQPHFTLSSSHRSQICPWPQHHRGIAPLFCFINKLKSLSSKIIPIAVFKDKLLFLKIILLFTFYGKVCGKSISFSQLFGMSITVWSRCSDFGSNVCSISLRRPHL